MTNVTHFPDQGKAIAAWTTHHRIALEKAVEAGVHGETKDLAYSWEAFGEHFLTDCFSGGHIRTPRATMLDWYRACFAARALKGLKAWMVEQLVSQLSPTLAAVGEAAVLASFVPALDDWLREKLALAGAGAVSGAIHDLEGDLPRGVWVRSAAHPTPWKAYGDEHLDYAGHPGENALDNKKEAERAIQRARWDVDKAFDRGREAATQFGATELAVLMAQGALANDQVVSPYEHVLAFVPHALPVEPGGNVPLEEWRWGAITPQLVPLIDIWIKAKVGSTLDQLPGKVPQVIVIPEPFPLPPTYVFPRALVEEMVKQLKDDGTRTLGRVIKWPATPSLAEPGNPAYAPEGACAVPPMPRPPVPPPTPEPHQHVVTLPEEVLHFKFDEAVVDPADHTRVIEELEKEMGPGLAKADLSQPVQVQGFTDSIGSAAYNLDLSQRRADAVKAILEGRYSSLRGHVVSQGLGATHFVAPNRRDGRDDPEGRRKNRRVEVLFHMDVVDDVPTQ
jgi:outer membrane protein OmpA-like peptidoglycan-associated protein